MSISFYNYIINIINLLFSMALQPSMGYGLLVQKPYKHWDQQLYHNAWYKKHRMCFKTFGYTAFMQTHPCYNYTLYTSHLGCSYEACVTMEVQIKHHHLM
jgi:hypothetical protein